MIALTKPSLDDVLNAVWREKMQTSILNSLTQYMLNHNAPEKAPSTWYEIVWAWAEQSEVTVLAKQIRLLPKNFSLSLGSSIVLKMPYAQAVSETTGVHWLGFTIDRSKFLDKTTDLASFYRETLQALSEEYSTRLDDLNMLNEERIRLVLQEYEARLMGLADFNRRNKTYVLPELFAQAPGFAPLDR
jgi:hypothetical protein